jgi:hypothetical protein
VSEKPTFEYSLKRLGRLPRVRLGAVIALAIAAAFVVWLLVRGGGHSAAPLSPTATPKRGFVEGASATRLKSFAASLDHPIYWVGPKPGVTYELTETGDGRIYIRYLPAGFRVGERRSFLTIVTYPYRHALAALRAVSGGKGFAITGGGLALVDRRYPQSVHVAFPGLNYQVEVYDPSPARSRLLVMSGKLTPVG